MDASLFNLLDVLYCAERYGAFEALHEPIPRCGLALREARRLGYIRGSIVTSQFQHDHALRLTTQGVAARARAMGVLT